MKVKVTKNTKPTSLQKAFAAPFDATSEAEFKGLMFVEKILLLTKEKGINRTMLAERMGVSSSRVTAMLNGTSNFTLEAQIRAAKAVGAELHQTLAPSGLKAR